MKKVYGAAVIGLVLAIKGVDYKMPVPAGTALPIPFSTVPREIFTDHQGAGGKPVVIHALAFTPDSKIVASGSGDKTVKLWDAQTGKLLKTLMGHPHEVKSIAFAPDNKTLASGVSGWDDERLETTDGEVRLWDFRTGMLMRTIPERGSVTAVTYVPGQNIMAAATGYGRTELRDASSSSLLRALRTSATGAPFAFAPDGQLMATGYASGMIEVFNVPAGTLVKRLQPPPIVSNGPVADTGNSWDVKALAFLPDHKTLVVGSLDWTATLRLWDIRTGSMLNTLAEGQGIVAVAVSPDGKLLAVADNMGTLEIWDTQTWQVRQRLLSKAGALTIIALVFSPNGKLLASGGIGQTIRLWQVQ